MPDQWGRTPLPPGECGLSRGFAMCAMPVLTRLTTREWGAGTRDGGRFGRSLEVDVGGMG